MSSMIEFRNHASRPFRRSQGAAATVGDDFGRALRAAMRAYVVSLGGTPMMYQITGLSVEAVGRTRVRVDGGLESCMVTALFPGVRVRAFSNSPGGWFSQTATPGYRPQGTSVVCSARDGRTPRSANGRAAVLPVLL